MLNGLVIVSNRLPISVKKTDTGLEFFPSIGGLATGLAGFAKLGTNKWIGWPGISSDQITPEEKTEITNKFLEHNCYPVFLSQKQLDNYYSGYSNRILWPLFHGLAISQNSAKHQKLFWEDYQQVNNIFAEAVIKLCPDGSNIWVHDYHLLLLPAIIRSHHPRDKIGFFQHIPFPAAESFINLSESELLTKGMLGADLIGFHTKKYALNFTNTCDKLNLGQLAKEGINFNNHYIKVANFPMGIDYKKFVNAIKSPEVKNELTKLKTKYYGLKTILTVDRLDPTKGLVERVIAYRDLLRHNPPLHSKVIMIMLTVPSRTKIEEYKKLHRQLEKLIKDVNTEFQTELWQPIEYMYTCLEFDELAALYQHADIAFITPLCDGMNLVAKEYLACKCNSSGVLILSNTAGASEELQDALIVDITDASALTQSLAKAITMTKSEQRSRIRNMQKQISTFTVQNWYDNYTNVLFNIVLH